MLKSRSLKYVLVTTAVVLLTMGAMGCGGGGGSGSGTTGTGSTGGTGSADSITMSENGQSAVTYNETSGLPAAGGYDPRIDFAFSQVIMYRDFNGSDFSVILDFMFLDASVGDYDIGSGDILVTYMTYGTNYMASIGYPNSNGLISITRSDSDGIEGTFNVDMVDAAAGTGSSPAMNITGSFNVSSGIDL